MKSLKRLFSRRAVLKDAATAEAHFWDYLDACGIPFRTPMVDLITRHGSFPTPFVAGSETCIIEGAQPFVAGQDRPPFFQFSARTDISAVPERLWCAVDANPDHRLNYAKAIHALVQLFGEGEVRSGGDSTARHWNLGHAQLSCTVYPPEKNLWRDTPHERPQRDRVKASICIVPNWRLPVSPQETTWLATAEDVLGTLPDSRQTATITPLTRDLPAGTQLAPGVAFAPGNGADKGGAILRLRADGLVDILPQARAETVELHRVTAGRGGVSATLSLGYTAPGAPQDQPRQMLTLSYVSDAAHALDGAADRLAAKLNLGLNTHDQVDV